MRKLAVFLSLSALCAGAALYAQTAPRPAPTVPSTVNVAPLDNVAMATLQKDVADLKKQVAQLNASNESLNAELKKANENYRNHTHVYDSSHILQTSIPFQFCKVATNPQPGVPKFVCQP